MDDKSISANPDTGGDSSEEEEDVVVTRHLKKSHRILDEDSDNSRDVPGLSISQPDKQDVMTAEDVLAAVLNDSSSDSEAVQTVLSSLKKKKVKRPVMDDSSDDDEDNQTLSNIVKTASHRILDEDSDNSRDVPGLSISQPDKPDVMTAEDVLSAVLNDSSSDSEAEQTVMSSLKKKKVKRPVMDDSSDDNEENQTLSNIVKTAESRTEIGDGESRDNHADADMESKEKGNEDSGPTIKLPSDLFDADDSDDPGTRSSSESSRSGSESEKEDEGFNESSIDPKLLAKLKKGAGKKAKRVSSAQQRKEEVTQLHSETQRIVRESRANVPYHQPAPKSINVFLARASRKQQEYKVLRGLKATTKARVLQDVLEKTRIKSAPITQEERDKYSDSDSDWNPDDDKDMSLKDRLDMKLKNQGSNMEENDDGKIVTDINTNCHTEHSEQSDNMVNSVCNALTESVDGSQKCANGDVDDDLPDLASCMKSHSIGLLTNETHLDENTLSRDKSESSNSVAQTICSSNDRTGECSDDMNSDVTRSSTDSLHNKVTSEEDSGVNTQEAEHEEKDSSVTTITEDKIVSEDKTELMETDIDIIAKDPVKDKDVELSDCKTLTNSKLAALAALELFDIKPCLSGSVEAVITLEEGESTPQHPGVAKLMDRLCKHTAKREKKHAKDMDISIIEKDQTGMDKEELKLTTITYHVDEEEDDPLAKLDKPGAKLDALKRRLQEKMRVRREAARQRRQELHDLDNEEGGYTGGVAGEDEDEMSEHSDTDIEDDDFEEQFGDDEMDVEEEVEETKREKNPFADEEAEDDGDDENDEQESNDDDDGSGDDEMNLKLDVSDVESDEEKITPGKKSRVAPISDDDKTSDVTDFKEPETERPPDKPFSMFGCRSRESSISDTQLQSGQRSFGLAMPIEDSQDLYGHTNTMPELATQPPSDTQPSQSFNFFLEDSQSTMLDADGYLKVKSTGKKPPRPTAIDDLAGTQGNMDDVLGLCSGRFAETQSAGKEKLSRKSLFEEGLSNTQGNMDQLMGLCSGVFANSNDEPSQKKGLKRKVSKDDDEDSCSGDSIVALSDNEDNRSEKAGFSDEEDQNDSGAETDEEKAQKFTGFTAQNKHGKILSEFVEDEAELSGSEFDSYENLDLPEEDDIMEMEEGDKDAAKLDQDELRDEVGRVHLKQLIDEDKRELVRFQEMYLPDGDLHSDGAGRTRQFRWSNMDDDTQQDMFNDSDGEHVEEEHDTDFQWRKERYEREKFIKEQQDKENVEDEGSQFLKFGKVFLKKQVSTEVTEKGDATNTADSEDPAGHPGSFYKLSSQKRGSFLARSKQDLAKIAERTKPVSNPSAGAKTGGKFTFSVISPDKETEAAQKPQLRKALSSNQAIKKPPAKKPKLEKSASFTQHSIFNHF